MILWDNLHGMPSELWMAAERALGSGKDFRRHRVGCVVRRHDGVLVSSKNGSTQEHRMPSGHAEARCAKKADKYSVAYVARVRKDGTIGCARPCASCRVQLRSRGVMDVFFTIGPSQWGRMRLHDESEHTWDARVDVSQLPW